MDLKQEQQLVERARSDVNTFGELYDRYYPQILGYVLKRTANIAAAQDVTSEVFFKALSNLHRFNWRGVPFSAWLYRIANNEVANHFRKNGHQQLELDKVTNSAAHAEPSCESELIAAESELKKHEDFLVLHANITRLPARYQEVIVLRFFENKKIREITEILGKQEGKDDKGRVIAKSENGKVASAEVDLKTKEVTEVTTVNGLAEAMGEDGKQKAIEIARADPRVKELLDSGAVIGKVSTIYVFESLGNVETGEVEESSEVLATVEIVGSEGTHVAHVSLTKGELVKLKEPEMWDASGAPFITDGVLHIEDNL
jgi:RNA polymerase sigma-70 factor, ECF subfamily